MIGLVTGLMLLQAAGAMSSGDVRAAAEADADAWRTPDPENLVIMEFGGEQVLIELAPHFAPQTVENIRELTRSGYFDQTSIVRVQNNYVVQWGAEEEDVQDGTTGAAPNRGTARDRVPGELDRARADEDFTSIDQRDTYAPTVGFSHGFAAAQDGNEQWLAHCYGAVGVGRGDDVDGTDGSSLYVVTGHAPRHLDRNVAVVGRVLDGMDAFHDLPAGSGELGFYTAGETKLPLDDVRLASELPEAERPHVEVMRTDTALFRDWVDTRANRTRDGWFVRSAGAIDLCNIPVPVRFPDRDEGAN
ncbi:hypothetical protein B5C34_13255 [Pacificimonas flava]|uniref:peptidylprolyl isomerase n=2 Tax=Pacificimonas TaxID=1960290 RepID=A0A219B7H0_9SPHN|nr:MULTISPECIES: peptidylprolyl isomerase [Pacificimonas]MBZ6378363.1 peptidylprolyl isomerase [Pacificimonas aurantium]OWV34330.1 hypothetical protein B5C34_13255 [Pacificimonas flava]